MTTYTIPEAVQIRIGNRWRNGTVRAIKQRGSFVEITAEYLERGKPARVLLDAESPDLRKWGEGKIAKERPPMKGYKPRKGRVRYQRAMPRVD
jgi:hypothetical protein